MQSFPHAQVATVPITEIVEVWESYTILLGESNVASFIGVYESEEMARAAGVIYSKWRKTAGGKRQDGHVVIRRLLETKYGEKLYRFIHNHIRGGGMFPVTNRKEEVYGISNGLYPGSASLIGEYDVKLNEPSVEDASQTHSSVKKKVTTEQLPGIYDPTLVEIFPIVTGVIPKKRPSAEENSFGNFEDEETGIVFMQLPVVVAIGRQDHSSTEKGLASVLPLGARDRYLCEEKRWRYLTKHTFGDVIVGDELYKKLAPLMG